jgi:hypothetical protein
MAVTFQAVADTMADMNITQWKVKSRSGSLIGYENKCKDVDLSLIRLRKLLDQLQDDFVRVELQPNPSSTEKGGDMKSIIKMDVDLSSMKPVSGIPMMHAGADNKELEKLREQVKRLELEKIELTYKQQITDLHKKIDGIKDEDPIGRLLDVITPVLAAYIPQMMGAKAPAPAVINGPPMSSSDEDRVNIAVNRLMDAIPEFPTVIEKLADFAERDPEKIKMLIGYL